MITLTFILLLIATISTLTLRKKCKDLGKPFDPLAGSFIEWMSFLYGWVGFSFIILSLVINLMLKYLP
jgi:hypothetical protein